MVKAKMKVMVGLLAVLLLLPAAASRESPSSRRSGSRPIFPR